MSERDFFSYFLGLHSIKLSSPFRKVAHNDYLLKLQLRKNLPLTAGRERMTQGRSG